MSQTIWHCEYHIVWCPKYRYRVLDGKIKEEVEICVRSQSSQMECEVVELNVQSDHVHLVVMVPPKTSISKLYGSSERKVGHYAYSACSGICAKSAIGAIIYGRRDTA